MQLIGFAEELAVVGIATTVQLLEDVMDLKFEAFDSWMVSKGLELPHHKSEEVILFRRRAFVPSLLTVGDHQITISDKIRYQVVILDNKGLIFETYVDTVVKKATRKATSLVRLMPNIGGQGQWSGKGNCSARSWTASCSTPLQYGSTRLPM